VRCEYPVANWDPAFAHTLGREPFNPRPKAYAHIHNSLAPHSNGFISYSDGVNDDVNKFVWTALSWDPSQDVAAILKEYASYLVEPEHAEGIAEGLLMLERNWEGPLASNAAVAETLTHWTQLEQAVDSSVRVNWRFQQMLLRARYDACTQRRLCEDVQREADAHAALSKAEETGVEAAVKAARAALATEPARETLELREAIEKLGEQLYRGIGMQLDVKRYGASGAERGAVLEFLDNPLNNRTWLEKQFGAILKETDRAKQIESIHAILAWEDPGPGGFYDDLGNAAKEPHLVRPLTWSEDPGFIESVQDGFTREAEQWRQSWRDQAETLYGTPLRVRYEGLDVTAKYRVKATYAGRYGAKMRLTADDAHLIHDTLGATDPPAPQTFDVPVEATKDGTLELRWDLVEGRGCQVAEVWLIKGS
jgi:hypothetical protein